MAKLSTSVAMSLSLVFLALMGSVFELLSTKQITGTSVEDFRGRKEPVVKVREERAELAQEQIYMPPVVGPITHEPSSHTGNT